MGSCETLQLIARQLRGNSSIRLKRKPDSRALRSLVRVFSNHGELSGEGSTANTQNRVKMPGGWLMVGYIESWLGRGLERGQEKIVRNMEQSHILGPLGTESPSLIKQILPGRIVSLVSSLSGAALTTLCLNVRPHSAL